MNYYNIGKLVNTQGINGEVRVISVTDFPKQRYQKGNVVYAKLADKAEMVKLTIKSVRNHKNFIILSFEGYNSINDVEFLKPSMLQISEEMLNNDDLAEGEYYYHQIIGLKVKTLEGEELGTIKEILSPGANDVWVVKRPQKADLLLPKIDDVIKQVDLDNQEIIVDLLEGLE